MAENILGSADNLRSRLSTPPETSKTPSPVVKATREQRREEGTRPMRPVHAETPTNTPPILGSEEWLNDLELSDDFLPIQIIEPEIGDEDTRRVDTIQPINPENNSAEKPESKKRNFVNAATKKLSSYLERVVLAVQDPDSKANKTLDKYYEPIARNIVDRLTRLYERYILKRAQEAPLPAYEKKDRETLVQIQALDLRIKSYEQEHTRNIEELEKQRAEAQTKKKAINREAEKAIGLLEPLLSYGKTLGDEVVMDIRFALLPNMLAYCTETGNTNELDQTIQSLHARIEQQNKGFSGLRNKASTLFLGQTNERFHHASTETLKRAFNELQTSRAQLFTELQSLSVVNNAINQISSSNEALSNEIWKLIQERDGLSKTTLVARQKTAPANQQAA